MLEQVSNYEQEIEFVEGFAGSGKSTELSKRATKTTLVMTPTHKAAEVLMAKGVPAYTIHSVLKLVPTINENFRKGQRLQTLKRVGKTKLDEITDVFIDEYSMINMDILDMLLSMLPAHCKVTVFGDPYQLPPIQGEAIDSSYYTDKITELITQHRADAPEVVETFMRFMNYIKGSGEMNLKLNPKIKTGTLKKFNPDTDKILAYTNAKVLELNAEAGKLLGKGDIVVGDDILINDMKGALSDSLETAGVAFPKTMSKGRMMEGGDFEEASTQTIADIAKFRTNLSDYARGGITIEGINYECWYDLDHYANSKKFKADVEKYQHLVVGHHGLSKDEPVAKWCKSNKGAKYVKERAQAWSKYLAHQSLVFNIRRPYAVTVHKAQGQEFKTVYIAQSDMKKAIRNGYYMQYARLMYVALSRAINKVIIV